MTRLHQGELSQDVVARMAKNRVFPFDHIASLCSLFKAKELDRSICEPGIAQALLEFSPRNQYRVSAGVLDAGTVWQAICRHVFDSGGYANPISSRFCCGQQPRVFRGVTSMRLSI